MAEYTSLRPAIIIIQRLGPSDERPMKRSKGKSMRTSRNLVSRLLSKNLFKKREKLERKRRKRRIMQPIMQHIPFMPLPLPPIPLYPSTDPGSSTVELTFMSSTIARDLLPSGQGGTTNALVAARTYTQLNL